MLVDESKYNWSKWQQPILTNNDSWGEVSATSIHESAGISYEPYLALDGDDTTHFEGDDSVTPVQFKWIFEKPLKIYRIELVNKPSSSVFYSKDVSVYADDEMTEFIIGGEFPSGSRGVLNLEPTSPFSTDRIVLNMTTVNKYVGLSSIRIIAEIGEEKVNLSPYLDTSEGMEIISNSYNDDGVFTTAGLDGFMFNGILASTMHISSNHYIGFGVNSEQLKICRRDGCSTAIYRQLGELPNGIKFLKIRFEGYTVYNNRVEANRLIFELFLLSNNDMFLNVIQTPTSSNTGTSNLVSNNKTTDLTLVDGTGGGTVVSFYHEDEMGLDWNVLFEIYDEIDSYSSGYLMKQNNRYYTILDNELVEVPIETLTAAMFLKYGFDELPSSEIITPLVSPEVLHWQTDGDQTLLKANVKAYPYSQTLTSVIDMSHISILGIKLMTAEFSGNVGLEVSLDNGETFAEEVLLSEWLGTDVEELWNSLNEERKLILHFILHDNAAISRFKITYIN